MTGYDCQLWERTVEKAKNLNLILTVVGDSLDISGCGRFHTVEETFQFLCGFEAGFDRGMSMVKWRDSIIEDLTERLAVAALKATEKSQ